MATEFEKYIAEKELMRRRIEKSQKEVESIQSLPDWKLKEIVDSPTDEEDSGCDHPPRSLDYPWSEE